MKSAEYMAWENMKSRCYNKKFPQFNDYGGRGIEVCEQWRGPKSFQNFLKDVGPRPSAQHSLDRFPNPDGNYEPGNVRWATRKEQNRNTSKNVFLTVDGVSRTISEWCELKGLMHNTVRGRLARGWTEETAVNTPSRPKLPNGHRRALRESLKGETNM